MARRGGEGLPVVYPGRDEAGRLAAVELARLISRLAGCHVSLTTTKPGERCIELVSPGDSWQPPVPAATSPDSFRRTVSPAGVRIEATTGRGLLYGAYDLLHELGCRWYYPGPVGERVPHLDEVCLPHGVRSGGPAFPGRSLILGHDLYLPDLEGWLEWAARNGLNNVFLHEFPPPLLGGRSAGHWRQALARAGPAAARRGLVIEFGGHGLAGLLPRRLFRSHPDYFRHDGRRRTPDHNLCPSSPGALDVVRRSARAYFEARPGAGVYHLWPDDIVGEGWCRCERCSSFSPPDQALLVTNAVAQVLEEVAPGALLAFLVYHDTIEPPARVRPRPNVSMVYAPRERCYAHALDDPSCEVNRDYHRLLQEGLARLGQGPGTGPGAQPRVFEYHLDAFLFKSMLPPLPRVMAGDLGAYLAAGVHTAGALMTSDRPWVTTPVNLWLFARLTWDPQADTKVLLEDFAAGVLGDARLARYYEKVEEAFGPVLELDGQGALLRMPGAGILDSPPADALDFLGAAAPAAERKLGQVRRSRELAAEARALLVGANAPALGDDGGPALTGDDRAALAGERADLDLTARQLEFLESRQEAVVALRLSGSADSRDSGADEPRTEAAIGRAWAALEGVDKWGRRHLKGWLPRAQFAFLHGMWGVQLLHLERTLAGRTGRPRVRDISYLFRLGVWWAVLRLFAPGGRRATPHHRTSG